MVSYPILSIILIHNSITSMKNPLLKRIKIRKPLSYILEGWDRQAPRDERCWNLSSQEIRKLYYFMGLYLEVPISPMPIVPKGIGHIRNSSYPVNISIIAIVTITIPIQNINLLGFLVSYFIFCLFYPLFF